MAVRIAAADQADLLTGTFAVRAHRRSIAVFTRAGTAAGIACSVRFLLRRGRAVLGKSTDNNAVFRNLAAGDDDHSRSFSDRLKHAIF